MTSPDTPVPPPYRIGLGYDIHRAVQGRPLILGGVEIPSSFGLEGHSDADCLTHAIADALLGSIAQGDIGVHFPNTDASIEGIDSQKILRDAARRVVGKGYRIANVDAMLIAERPKIGPHVPAMRKRLASTLDLPESGVSLKATTNEGLGALGAAEGIAAHATVLIYRPAVPGFAPTGD